MTLFFIKIHLKFYIKSDNYTMLWEFIKFTYILQPISLYFITWFQKNRIYWFIMSLQNLYYTIIGST